MLHAICDFCGKDADRTAYLLSISAFKNFARYHSDTEPYGSKSQTKSFVMCGECLKKHGIPNPYHDYSSITDQDAEYKKCLDNYTDEDFKNDARNNKGVEV